MQKLTVLFVQDVETIEQAISCDGTVDTPICNKLTAAFESGHFDYNLTEFIDVPARNEYVAPSVVRWNLRHFPALIFIDGDTGLSFYALDGNRITEQRIRKIMETASQLTDAYGNGQYMDGHGQSVDIEDEINKKLGGVLGADWGLPLGGMWSGCKSYMPDSVDKVCDIPIWFYGLVLLIMLILLIKMVS